MQTSTKTTGVIALLVVATSCAVIATFDGLNSADAQAYNKQDGHIGIRGKGQKCLNDGICPIDGYVGGGYFGRIGKQGSNLEQLVKDGIITQEQADALRSMDRNTTPDRPTDAEKLEHLAKIFNITTDEVKAKLESGKRPEDIAVEVGMTIENFRAATEKQHADYLAKKVARGELTTLQADALQAIHKYRQAHQEEQRSIRLKQMATVLGISPSDLESKLNNGQKPQQIAAEVGMSNEDFAKAMKTAMLETLKKNLAEKVARGELTQDEANNIIARHENRQEPGFLSKGQGNEHRNTQGGKKSGFYKSYKQGTPTTTQTEQSTI